MAASLIYRSALVYELAMLGIYGRSYFSRYRAIAELIPYGASVVELCCGPGVLYRRYLRRKAVEYTGLDLNQKFMKNLMRNGVRGEVWDLRRNVHLPRADYIVMQASLYHFLPDPAPVVERMLEAARKQVVIAEPIRNLADARIPFFSALARRSTDPGGGRHSNRFTEQSLDQFLTGFSDRPTQTFNIPGGREKVYVISTQSQQLY